MELRELIYFLAVANEKNFTRASEVLNLSQPALSKQIMNLEDKLGTPLFLRGKREATLTEAGELLKIRAEEILELCNKTISEVSSQNDLLKGTISIGGGAASTFLAKACSLFSKQNPHVQFSFYNADATELKERINHGLLDFAIFIDDSRVLEYERIELPDEDEWGLLCNINNPITKHHKITKDIIRTIPLIIPNREEIRKELSQWAESDKLNIISTFNTYLGTAKAMIQDGAGCGYVLRSMQDNNTLTFIPLEPHKIIKYSLCYKESIRIKGVANAFLQFLSNIKEK